MPQLFVNTLIGIDMEEDDTIDGIRCKIRDEEGMRPDAQRLKLF